MKRVLLGIVFILSGCIALKPNPDGFNEKQIQTEHFSIAVWERQGIESGKPLRLYIEGDGNPNPRYQIAKQFAEQDTTNNVIYLARPCQWSQDKICSEKPQIYKEHRFHPEIMAEMYELIEYLIRKYKAPSVELIAYDGGAVVALYLAPKLPTSRIITIAGITDTDAYANYKGIEFPPETVNPALSLAAVAAIPQIHYVGSDDTETPPKLVQRFVSKMHNPISATVKMVHDTTHTDWGDIRLDY